MLDLVIGGILHTTQQFNSLDHPKAADGKTNIETLSTTVLLSLSCC